MERYKTTVVGEKLGRPATLLLTFNSRETALAFYRDCKCPQAISFPEEDHIRVFTSASDAISTVDSFFGNPRGEINGHDHG